MFIKNNRGINNNSDLPAEYLAFLYHRVVEEEWTLENSTASDSKFTGIKIKSLQSIPGVSVFSPQDSQQLFLSGVATALGFSNGKLIFYFRILSVCILFFQFKYDFLIGN
jgi:Sec7-like guanine-nucleotide exchange factor